MANSRIYIRRTSVAGRVPNTTQINTGELGLNMTDGILYSSNGSYIFTIGANVVSQNISNNVVIGNSSIKVTANSSSIYISNSTANVFSVDSNGLVTGNGAGLTSVQSSNNTRLTNIVFSMDGSNNVITTGVKGFLSIDFDCTIQQVTLLTDRTGNISVDIWKTTYANFDAGTTHPVYIDNITANVAPAIVNGTKYINSSLSGWNTTINAGDILGFYATANTVQKATLTIKVLKS
jgi:hypothetical protein